CSERSGKANCSQSMRDRAKLASLSKPPGRHFPSGWLTVVGVLVHLWYGISSRPVKTRIVYQGCRVGVIRLRSLGTLWATGAAFCAICAVVLWLGFGGQEGMVATELNGTCRNPHRLLPMIGVLLLSIGLVAILVRKESWLTVLRTPSTEAGWHRAAMLLIVAGFVVSLMAVWVLRAFPNSGDEYAYLFQARTFLAGRLWNPLLPGHDFFSFFHIAEKDGKWASTYPPGWPLLLAALNLAGLPAWVASPVLATVLLVMLVKLCERDSGPIASIVALTLIVFSPFWAFNAGSFFSHVPAALFGLLFCYFGAEFIDSGSWRAAILAGVSLG